MPCAWCRLDLVLKCSPPVAKERFSWPWPPSPATLLELSTPQKEGPGKNPVCVVPRIQFTCTCLFGELERSSVHRAAAAVAIRVVMDVHFVPVGVHADRHKAQVIGRQQEARVLMGMHLGLGGGGVGREYI